MKADLSLPCLSIRQPWAWFILHAGKDVENRTWPTRFRGRFNIHAAKGCTFDEYSDAVEWAIDSELIREGTEPSFDSLPRGGIVGTAEIVNCIALPSRGQKDVWELGWLCGPYGFVLRHVQPVDFHPCRGALGFFRVPEVQP